MIPDIVVRNGTVLDGTGAPPIRADLVIAGGRIAELTSSPPVAAEEIDASGLIVSPGFIDIHSHADFTLLVDPRAQSALSQGVTLEVLGNCGHGCFPIRNAQLAKTAIYGVSDHIALDWNSCAGYLDLLEAASPAVNVITLVPNGQLRQAVTGIKDGKANRKELGEMVRLLEDGLEAGAFGYSTGLEYPLERGADSSEISRLLEPVAARSLLYATHTRDRDESAAEAVAEAIETARRSEVRLQISHLMPRGSPDDADRCIELVDTAKNSGQDIAFDMHTRKFSMTFLHAMLPPWALGNDIAKMAGDLEASRRIIEHKSVLSTIGWERIVLLDNDVVPQFSRMTITDIAGRMNLSPARAALQLLCDAAGHPQPLMIIAQIYSNGDQKKAFSHPLCMPGSDATTLAMDGPLANSTFHGAYDWASWFYRFTVHEHHILNPETAIHRLTGQPAAVLGLSDRGVIKPGAMADIAIFDDPGFREQTTLWQPNSLSSGMKYVLVNGSVAYRDGKVSPKRTGKVLRKLN
ncbi:MAG: amidohydrolase family protein [Rhizobiaceae bacterium]